MTGPFILLDAGTFRKPLVEAPWDGAHPDAWLVHAPSAMEATRYATPALALAAITQVLETAKLHQAGTIPEDFEVVPLEDYLVEEEDRTSKAEQMREVARQKKGRKGGAG